MTLGIYVGVGLACLASVVPAANAATHETYRAGEWSTYSGNAEDQRQVCGIVTNAGADREIAVEQFPGDQGLDIRLRKTTWTIPDNTAVNVQLQFDGRGAVPSRALGTGRVVTLHLQFADTVTFMRALRYGTVLRVYFPDGNEIPWSASLSGSGAAISAFNDCRATLAPAEPTQPYRVPADQPPPTSPTQPFAPNAPG